MKIKKKGISYKTERNPNKKVNSSNEEYLNKTEIQVVDLEKTSK